MSYKCLECGFLFNEGDEARWVESHGEPMKGCPCCGGAYEETERCAICGGEFLHDELLGTFKEGVCQDCFDEYKNNFDICFSLGEKEKEEVEINSCLVSILGVPKIESILYHYLKETKDVDCSNFVAIDESWFAENLAEEVRKYETRRKN